MALAEFEIIERYFSAATGPGFARDWIERGIGDDCALLAMAAGEQLAVSMDLLVEGVHFPEDADPLLLAQRCLLVNLSDLAAMGARPLGFTLGISLPAVDENWLERFSEGLSIIAREHDCPLIGGDTTSGPLTICIQVHGAVPCGQALLRSGARPDDLVCITGTLGDAAAGLALIQGRIGDELTDAERQFLLQAFYQPVSRLAAGQALRRIASAAIDVSDGIASDLLHILDGSGVGARINLEALPLSPAFRAAVPAEQRIGIAVGGGDDYELCFTVAEADYDAVKARLDALGVAVSCIGTIERQAGLRWYDNGRQQDLNVRGYTHFE